MKEAGRTHSTVIRVRKMPQQANLQRQKVEEVPESWESGGRNEE